MKRETATVTAFMPSKFGTKVELNDNEIAYLHDSVQVDTGMQIKFSRHDAGSEHTLMNGKKITFKEKGIHDIMIVTSARRAEKIALHKLVAVEEYA